MNRTPKALGELLSPVLFGKVQSLKLLELPEAKDLSEWISGGGTRDALLELIRNAAEWKREPVAWRNAFKSIDEMEGGEIPFLVDKIIPEGVTFVGALCE